MEWDRRNWAIPSIHFFEIKVRKMFHYIYKSEVFPTNSCIEE